MRLPTHAACNKSYRFDEDYFVNTLAPFSRGSYSGNAVLTDIFAKFHKGEKVGLVMSESLEQHGLAAIARMAQADLAEVLRLASAEPDKDKLDAEVRQEMIEFGVAARLADAILAQVAEMVERAARHHGISGV